MPNRKRLSKPCSSGLSARNEQAPFPFLRCATAHVGNGCRQARRPKRPTSQGAAIEVPPELAQSCVQVSQQGRHLLVAKAACEGRHHSLPRQYDAPHFRVGRGRTAGQRRSSEHPMQIRRNLLQRQVIVLVAVRAAYLVEMLAFGLLGRKAGRGATPRELCYEQCPQSGKPRNTRQSSAVPSAQWNQLTSSHVTAWKPAFVVARRPIVLSVGAASRFSIIGARSVEHITRRKHPGLSSPGSVLRAGRPRSRSTPGRQVGRPDAGKTMRQGSSPEP